MNEQRYAVLIAGSRFPQEPTLQDLRCPENDVDGLSEVLKKHGDYSKVAVLKNRPGNEILVKINEVLKEVGKNDLVVIYYSGHGKLNMAGRLHLATVDTVVRTLEATSIPVQSIRNYIDISPSNKIILILDCCYSGAAGDDFTRGSVDEQLQFASRGRGTCIMTASTGIQVAREKEQDRYGVFTKYIIEGIGEGKADRNNDGFINMGELYEYVRPRVRGEGCQEPMMWDIGKRGGELFISRSGKTPREERRSQISEKLLDLAVKKILPNTILRKALEVIDLNTDQLTGTLKSYDLLLDSLLQDDIDVGRFIDEWYKVKPETPPVKPRETAKKDGNFIAYDNGVVYDSKTGLEWIAGPDKDTTWDEAEAWVKQLDVDGGDWDMPAIEQLRGLYKKGAGTRNMTPLLKTTGRWVWSGETHGSSSARFFGFGNGNGYRGPRSGSYSDRVFAVRSRSR